MRWSAWLPLVLSSCIAPPAFADVSVSVDIPGPPILAFEEDPPLVYADDGLQVVPDIDEEILFYDGFYWRYWGDRWYRSSSWRSGWVFAPPPPRFRGFRPGRYRHYHAPPGRGWHHGPPTHIYRGGGGTAYRPQPAPYHTGPSKIQGPPPVRQEPERRFAPTRRMQEPPRQQQRVVPPPQPQRTIQPMPQQRVVQPPPQQRRGPAAPHEAPVQHAPVQRGPGPMGSPGEHHHGG